MGQWEEKVKEEKKRILAWKTKDRLSLLAKITFMNSSMAASISGWNSWLSNPMIMEEFSKEELENLEKGFQDLATTFLDLDILYTELLGKKRGSKKKKEKKKTTKKKKIPYMV